MAVNGEVAVRIAAPGMVFSGAIDARVFVAGSAIALIAAHPWGPLGGSMDDIVVQQCVSTFAAAGCTTARFNFRSGIGRGWGSMEDVRLVANYLLHELPEAQRPTQLIICGYSYGSLPAAAVATSIPECVGYVVIAPPLDNWAANWIYCFNQRTLRNRATSSAFGARPKLLLIGDRDNFCSMETFSAFADEMPGPKTVRVLPGLDHFRIYTHVPRHLKEWASEAWGIESLTQLAAGPPSVCRAQAEAAGQEATPAPPASS